MTLLLSMWALVAVALACIVYYTVRRNVDFTLLDFICTNGRGDPQKAAYTGSFLISTWLIWSLIASDKITEGYFGLYIGAFVAGGALKAMSRRPRVDIPDDR